MSSGVKRGKEINQQLNYQVHSSSSLQIQTYSDVDIHQQLNCQVDGKGRRSIPIHQKLDCRMDGMNLQKCSHQYL